MTIEKVTKDMLIAEVIGTYPLAADIMESFGLKCTGCSVNTRESIEAGAGMHALSDDQVASLVEEINFAISSGKLTKAEEPAETKDIVVTDKAAEKMKSILKEQGKEGWGIRVLVAAGGCAGSTYSMDFSQKAVGDDKTLEFQGLKVFVDSFSQKKLSGVTVDYVENLNEQGFKFDNPNAKAGCGCGKSFA